MTSRHQFHLRWSNYGQNLANSFVRLFESESLSDVTLFCEGESYRAHRVVLAASSAHFQELFEQCSTAQNLVVILDGTTAANLRALLEFMYKGEVYIDDANLNTFLQTAKRLQVKGLSLSQNDLHSISSDVVEERTDGKLPPFSSAGASQDNILAQALGPILIPPQQQQQQQQQQLHPQHPAHQQQQQQHQGPPLQNKNTNSVQSPPTSFSSPSPSQTPPTVLNTGMYGDDKNRGKKRSLPSPRHPSSPNGAIPEGVEYSGLHHPPRTSAPMPAPSPTMNARIMEMDQRERQSMVPGSFQSFGPHYSPSVPASPSGPPPSVPLQQSQSHQQQTIVITENPNMRKMRSVSTENTMPEDLSIKLEVGRAEEMSGGMGGKQRSFSMDLSPSEPPFGGLGGPPVWSLPSPSSLSAQHAQQQHDLNVNISNAQSTADGKKLKCPFCERLYGYETNLRAHIRQRHQGIRVPCPFCTRTFTRNNTVRRHVAREHRALIGGVGPVIGPGVRTFPHMPPEAGGALGPQFGSPPRGGGTGGGGGSSTSSSSPKQGSPGSAGNPAGASIGVVGNTSGGHMMSGEGALGGLRGMGPGNVPGGMGGPMSAVSPPLHGGGGGGNGNNNLNRPNSHGNHGGGKPMD